MLPGEMQLSIRVSLDRRDTMELEQRESTAVSGRQLTGAISDANPIQASFSSQERGGSFPSPQENVIQRR
jgi:hypothetical protein